jgi:TonB-linked SusC/RagA family outer membrane protein
MTKVKRNFLFKEKKCVSRIKAFIFLIFLFSSFPAFSQRKIAGRALDAVTNEAIAGANVSIKSTEIGTVSDAKGNFELVADVPLPLTLIVSYIGYVTQEIDVYEADEVVTVLLNNDYNSLNQIVVVGYGTQRKKELTGSIASVSQETLRQLSTSFDNLLGGAISGLNVTQTSGQPGAAFEFRIRGGNSVTGGNEPLYVIDGVIVYEDGSSSSTSAGVGRIEGRLNPLASINPGDIESIQVLKDVSATAIYGSRGSNGVIIITTKSGKKGKTNIEYQYSTGWQRVAKKLDLLNAREWAELNREANPYSTITDAELATLGDGDDWQSAALRVAVNQSHQLTLSGGDEKTRYLISGNFTDHDGIILNTDFKRYSGRFNFERDLFSNFTVGLNVNASKLNQNGLANYGGLEVNSASNSLDYLIGIPQTVPIYNPDGSYNYNNRFEIGDLRYGDRTVNALSDLENTVSQNISNNIIGNFFATYTIVPSLIAKISVGTNLTNATQNFFGPSTSAAGFLPKGYGSVGNRRTDSWQYEYTLNYVKKLNDKHYIDVLAGYSAQTTYIERTTATASNFANEYLGYHNLQAGSGFITPATSGSESVLNSVLGRVNYTLNGRYNLTATLRADGSSRFADGHKWGYFPSVGVSWNVNEEEFLKNSKTINALKIRASLGTVGNQEIGDYRYESTYEAQKYSFNNKIVVAYRKNNRENPELKWEQTSQYNAGVDISLLNYRLNLIADVYYKKTADLLLNVPIETTTGYTSMLKNVGNIINKGIEFDVSATPVSSKDFNWNLSANIAKNINRVIDVSVESGYIILGGSILQEGQPLGSFYGVVFDGVVQYTDDISKIPVPARKTTVEPGDVKYVDQNNDNQITQDDDRVILGSSQPDFTYGFSTTVRYKSLSLFASFQGSYGNKIYNYLRAKLESPDVSYNSTTALLDRWTPSNPSNTVPRADIFFPALSWLDSRYIEDASFLRLKNITLSYILPFRIVKAPSTKFRIFASAQNLLTLTNYSGYDPEIAGGVDAAAYPTAKTFSFGINISY